MGTRQMFRSVDWQALALMLGCGSMTGLAVTSPSLLGRAAAVCAAVFFAVSWSHVRMAHRLRAITKEMGMLPQTVTFQANDDGTMTALVSRLNGEPVVVTIPATVAEQGRDAVVHFLMHELDIDGEVEITVRDESDD